MLLNPTVVEVALQTGDVRASSDRDRIKHLYGYQRLERAKTANPELATIVALKQVFPEMSLDELLAG